MSRGRAAALCAIALAATWAAGGAKPGSGASRGANLRPRRIFLGNVGLNDARPMADGNSRRLRGRLRGGYARAQCEASPRLLCEGRHYGQAGREDWPAPGFEDWYNVGILCVNFSATLKDVGGTSLALNVGHQDILRGNGWLVLDGTPLDGSRAICFDAARTPAQLANLSRHGRVCGHLITGWLKAKLAPQISGHLVVEYLSPGDVYADNRQDESHFVRDELNFPW